METYFMLTLDEYATASFTSFPKLYFGTAEQIDTFFQAIGKDEDRTVGLDDLLNTYARYQSGESDIEHIVAHQKVSFIAPVQEVLGEASSILTNHQWDHLNIWGCPYHMRCDKAESKHLWLMSGDRCYRVISVRFSNLCYRDPFCLKAYATPDGPPWGFPHQFVLSSEFPTIGCLL